MLLNSGKRVRWDALPLLAAAVAFERIVIQWWNWHSASRMAAGLTFGMYLAILVSVTLLFLMAAVALPDEVEQDLDLREHYARTFRRYWLLFSAQWALTSAVSIWAQHAIFKAHIQLLSPVWVILPIALALAFIPNRLVQAAGLIGFLALYSVTFFGQTLA